jgi:hypothetical protein
MKSEEITLNNATQRPWKEAPCIVCMLVFEVSLSVCCHIGHQFYYVTDSSKDLLLMTVTHSSKQCY